MFYQGEDILFDIEVLDDEGNRSVVEEGEDFIFIFYTDKNEPIKFCTRDVEGYLKLDNLGRGKLSAKIPSEYSRYIKPGISKLEVKLINSSDNCRNVGIINPFIEILPTQIRHYDFKD